MKLLTQLNLKELAKYPIQTNQDHLDKSVAVVKWFTPWKNWTWYVCEWGGPKDPDLFWGRTDSPTCSEWGYFRMSEIAAIKGPYGLKVERDLHWTAAPLPPSPF